MQVICFHKPNEINGYLSNWYLSDFTVDGQKFTSGEQWMMYSKAMLFGDSGTAAKILATDDVADIKALGRAVTPYSEKEWTANRVGVMHKGLKAKFVQNPELLYKLLATEDNILAECAASDPIWGIGLHMNAKDAQNPDRWRGQNLLGFILMLVRTELSAEKHS